MSWRPNSFFSPDTDVLVLAIVHNNKLLKTATSMVSGVVEISRIWIVLGEEKGSALALRVIHAFTVCTHY